MWPGRFTLSCSGFLHCCGAVEAADRRPLVSDVSLLCRRVQGLGRPLCIQMSLFSLPQQVWFALRRH